jgi:phosphopantothenoylcysteine decarboxylase/phosphopantothenate--cysteine ligase
MISGISITLIVGGSIAAYKSAELVRELVKQGARVNVVMTDSATKFISPLTLQTLSDSRVSNDLFDAEREAKISHITLADSADVVLVAPASADLIAKAANGIADDLPTTVLLATTAPVIFAPAMNVNMWKHPATVANLEILKGRGAHIVDPGEGELACGWLGAGRFAEISEIIDGIELSISKKDLSGSRVIVTAGPTREMIDPIRFVSNRSTGKMGMALARAARWRGADVKLVCGPTQLKAPDGIELFPVVSAQEMHDKVMELVSSPVLSHQDTDPDDTRGKQFVFMAAAVTDHRPESESEIKIKHEKDQNYALSMVPCPDILHELGQRRAAIEKESACPLKLVGFAAETGGKEKELLAWARGKLERKNADMIVGNFADDAFAKDTNRVWLLDRNGRQEEVAAADKQLIADKIIKAALRV